MLNSSRKNEFQYYSYKYVELFCYVVVYLSLCVFFVSSDRFSLQAHGELSVLRCVRLCHLEKL